MKIQELQKVSNDKVGNFIRNGVKLEDLETATFEYLVLFGFDIEIIIPTSLKGVSNPDSLISGAIWEIKTPISFNEQTIKNRFREAVAQSSRIVFDLRFVKSRNDKVEKQIISLFKGNRLARRLMIIEKNGRLLDISK